IELVVIAWRVRFGVCGVQNVVLVDVYAARAAELPPLIDEVPILIEDLNPAVLTVRHEQSPARIDRDPVRRIEFAGAASLLAPRLHELTVLGELYDSRVAVVAMAI